MDWCEDCHRIGLNRIHSELFDRVLCRSCFGDRVIIMGIEHATAEAASPDV